MKRLIYIVLLFFSLPLCKTNAQSSSTFNKENLTFAFGIGPTIYYDWEQDKLGFLIYLDSRYQLNNIISTTLSYSFNHLRSAQANDDGEVSYYFKTGANNLDLHFGFDLVQIANIGENFPLHIIFDVGGGLSFYKEGLYWGEAHPTLEGQLYNYYIDSQGWGCATKAHMGGEISYDINNTFTIFGNFLGHYYFSSKIDGKDYYWKTADDGTKVKTQCFNDMFMSSVIGLRFNIDEINLSGRPASSKSATQSTNRFFNRKSASSSVKTIKKKRNKTFKSRYDKRKTPVKRVPKKKDSERFKDRKTNGNIPKK